MEKCEGILEKAPNNNILKVFFGKQRKTKKMLLRVKNWHNYTMNVRKTA